MGHGYGLVLGALAGALLVAGNYAPFVLHLGGREPRQWSSEAGLNPYVTVLFFGLDGGLSGGACGMAAWALRCAARRLVATR